MCIVASGSSLDGQIPEGFGIDFGVLAAILGDLWHLIWHSCGVKFEVIFNQGGEEGAHMRETG